MISSCLTRSMTASTVGRRVSTKSSSSPFGLVVLNGRKSSIATCGGGDSDVPSCAAMRWKSSYNGNGGGSKRKKFRPSRAPTKGSYYYNRNNKTHGNNKMKNKAVKGVKEPYDISTAIPRIDKSQIRIRDALDADEDDDLTPLGPLMGGALRALRNENSQNASASIDVDELESQFLRTMDFFTSETGSTEDLVGSRRAVAAETYSDPSSGGVTAAEMLRRIDQLVDEERFEYMDLPKTESLGQQDQYFIGEGGDQAAVGGAGTVNQIPPNQLAHGDW